MSEQRPTIPMRGPGAAQLADGATWPATSPPGPRAPADEARLPRGAVVGRYLIVEPIGEGGMGVVYAAYDPELDRRIAIKVLRLGEADGTAGRARMQREAQALARLAHPNVIAIHDVGAVGGGLFLAMELAVGGTLRTWQRGRPWRDVVRAYVAAGRGLAAAHAAGLVHRDFKPDNVLIGGDGRVRVTDFGLVRASGEAGAAGAIPSPSPSPSLSPIPSPSPSPSPSPIPSPSPSPSPSPLSSSLTEAGAVMGTPHYMAPEQLAGGAADAASDQFALCVAAWEGLFGERPFAGDDPVVLCGLIDAGERRPPPPGTDVPARVLDALARGLAAAPADRWPSVDALLDELEVAIAPQPARAVPVARARAPWIGLALAAVAGVGVAAFATRIGGQARLDACAAAAGPGDAAWDDAARADVRAAFDASGAAWAASAFASFDRAVAGWRDRWRHAAYGACAAREAAPAAVAVRQQCLATQRARVAAVVAGLGASGAVGERLDADAVARLADPAALLPDVAACDDVAALAGREPEPAGRAAELARVRAAVATLAARVMTVDAAGARAAAPAADAVVADARAIGWAPLMAEALYERGQLAEQAGERDAARAALFEASNLATAARDDALAARALWRLAVLERQTAAAYADAERWLAQADAVVARLAEPDELRLELRYERARLWRAEARLADARVELEAVLAAHVATGGDGGAAALAVLAELAAVATDDGDLSRAQGYLDRALPLARARLGDRHPRTVGLVHAAGNVAYWVGDHDRAAALLAEAVENRRGVPGAAVELSATLGALGAVELARGRVDEGRALLEESLAISERELGPDHVDTAAAATELGGALHRAGDFAGALAQNQRALAIRERALGPDHPDVAVNLVNLAVELKALGRMAEVEPAYRRALAIFERARGAEHFQTGVTWLNLAEYLRVAGKVVDAAEAYANARRILTAVFGAGHVMLAHVDNGEGQLALARGDAARAVALLERAVSTRAADGGDAPALAESRFALARALVARRDADGAVRARARELTEAARAAWAAEGEAFAKERAAAEAWLARR